ncbi:MAG: hypothetical protein KIS66_06840 [Fimbriimonadaceae bacterium]|nr:hypothetical protein [Fimbriimonadaceae bacterium]
MVLVGLAALILAAPDATVKPNDARVHLIGRFDRRDPARPRCSWPATGIEVRVRGQRLEVDVTEDGDDRYQVEVDGQPTQVARLSKGDGTIAVDLASPKRAVTVRLVKRTEPFVGSTVFRTLRVFGGGFGKPTPPKNRVEFIGDSISCGFGLEGANEREPFSNETENAYLSYGAQTARAVGAEVAVVAWSGRKLWPDNGIPEIYGLSVPTDPESAYDFKTPAPEAVVINLGTNDFGQANPEEGSWTRAYEEFIARLRTRYPRATIYAATGSMMTDTWPPKNKALSTIKGYLDRMVARLRAKGDRRVQRIDFEPQLASDGYGSAWHPNAVTHHKMALKMTAALRKDLPKVFGDDRPRDSGGGHPE